MVPPSERSVTRRFESLLLLICHWNEPANSTRIYFPNRDFELCYQRDSNSTYHCTVEGQKHSLKIFLVISRSILLYDLKSEIQKAYIYRPIFSAAFSHICSILVKVKSSFKTHRNMNRYGTATASREKQYKSWNFTTPIVAAAGKSAILNIFNLTYTTTVKDLDSISGR